MTSWGVGPKIAVLSLLYYAVVVILHLLMPGEFLITRAPNAVFPVLGWALITIGAGLWASGVMVIDKAFRQGVLLTTGSYALVRHPMYSGMIVFIAPGVALCFRSWLLLTPSLVAYLVFRLLITTEESYLEDKFGQAYRDYKARTNAIIPFFRLGGKG